MIQIMAQTERKKSRERRVHCFISVVSKTTFITCEESWKNSYAVHSNTSNNIGLIFNWTHAIQHKIISDTVKFN